MEHKDSLNNAKKTISLALFFLKYPMGLDKGIINVFEWDVGIKQLLAQLGLGQSSLLRRGKRQRTSPLTEERMRFEKEVREQFVKLKEKGLSIPVFTL